MKSRICYSQSQMGHISKHRTARKVPAALLNPMMMPCLSAIVFPLLAIVFPNSLLYRAVAQTPRASHQTKSTQPVAQLGTQDPGTQIPGWTLKFAEECDGTALNYSKWSPHPPGKLILSGTQTWIPNAVEISGGQCHLLARRTPTGYTSAILTTFDTFAQTYGRFEIRFRLPAGRGLESLFQLLPIPTGDIPSIDVMNATGNEPTKALFGNHWGDTQGDRDYTGSYPVANLSSDFHIVTAEWSEDEIAWSVDGVDRFHSYDGIPHQPLYLSVRLAIDTPKAGEPDSQTKFPAALDIDYIRVFSKR